MYSCSKIHEFNLMIGFFVKSLKTYINLYIIKIEQRGLK